MSSYRGSGKEDRTKAITAVVLVHVALGAVILNGLNVNIVARTVERLQTFDIAIPDPPPPPPPPPPPEQRPEQKRPNEGGARKSPCPFAGRRSQAGAAGQVAGPRVGRRRHRLSLLGRRRRARHRHRRRRHRVGHRQRRRALHPGAARQPHPQQRIPALCHHQRHAQRPGRLAGQGQHRRPPVQLPDHPIERQFGGGFADVPVDRALRPLPPRARPAWAARSRRTSAGFPTGARSA